MSGIGGEPVCPDLANLQGMLVYRYPQAFSCILLFEIVEAARVPGFLRRWLPSVASGEKDPAALAGPVINIGLSWAGLAALLDGDAELAPEAGARAFDFAFTDQTVDHPAVGTELGFIERSFPKHWWDGAFRSSTIGLAVYVACDSEDQRRDTLVELRETAAASGLKELRVEAFPEGALAGRRPDGGILHFGYRDGVTTPNVDWADQHAPGMVDFREFVMGYPSPTHQVTPLKGAWRDFARDGSFACLAWIEQDVAAFNAFIASNVHLAEGEADAGYEAEWLAAKLMGRWRDGSALSLHPRRPPAPWSPDDAFGFGNDRAGRCCPLTAHVRVVNPRDDEMTYPNRVRFPAGPPRFIRRGFTYGSPLEGTTDDGVSRGIVGTFLCARVNEQFYTVLRWMQETQFAEGHYRKPYNAKMQDGLFGNRKMPGAKTGFPLARESGEPLRAELVDFIRYRGVSVFFLPSMASLARLCDRPAGRPAEGQASTPASAP